MPSTPANRLSAGKLGLLAALASLALAGTSFATDGTWTSTASGVQAWTTPTNWSSSIVGGGINSTVNITSNITTTTNVDLSAGSQTVGILNIGDSSGTSPFIIQTGTLTFNGTGGAQINMNQGGGNTISAATVLDSNLTITNNVAGTLTLSGAISGSGAITQNAGRVYISQTNTFAGGYILNNGTVAMGQTASMGTGTWTFNNGTLENTSTNARTPGNAINLGGSLAKTGVGLITFGGTVTLTANSTLTTTTTLNISGNITGAYSLTKAGGDSMTLSRAAGNAYGGGTIVSAGTLLVSNTSGSGTGTGSVTVDAAGILGGTGIISGATGVSGSLRPGTTGIGALTVTNDVTWNAGTAWVFELGTSAASLSAANTGGSTQDQLLLTGAGNDFLKGTGTGFTFNFGGTGAQGWYKLVDWASATTFVGGDFSVANLGTGLTGSFVVDAGTSALYLQVVPEPGTWSLLALGFLVLILARFRAVKAESSQR